MVKKSISKKEEKDKKKDIDIKEKKQGKERKDNKTKEKKEKEKKEKEKRDKIKEIKTKKSIPKLKIVLDLDGTLVHSLPIDTPSNARKFLRKKWFSLFDHHNIHYHKMDDDFLVVERPDLQRFLDWLVENFDVTIWSAASPEYVNFIRKKVFGERKIRHVFNSENCEDSQKIYGELKDLKLLWDKYKLKGFNSKNTLIIDDLKYNTSNLQPNNSIHIKKFSVKEENLTDNELLGNVKKKLEEIKENYEQNGNRELSFSLTSPITSSKS